MTGRKSLPTLPMEDIDEVTDVEIPVDGKYFLSIAILTLSKVYNQ